MINQKLSINALIYITLMAFAQLNQVTSQTNNGILLTLPILPHEHVIHRRLKERGLSSLEEEEEEETAEITKKQEQQQQITGLYQGYGTHYVDLWLGSPIPQRQTVIVDTGSDVTAFPCDGCKDCGQDFHTDHYFNHSKSESFQKVNCTECELGECFGNVGEKDCTMGLRYQEGSSWNAYESVDITYAGGGFHDIDKVLNNEHDGGGGLMPQGGASNFSFHLHFGCQNHITGFFKTQLADGIMGMSNENGAYWKQMYNEGAIKDQQFSLCFRHASLEAGNKNGTSAGAMTLGGTNTMFHQTIMVFAENIREVGYYTVEIKSIYLRTNGGLEAWGDDDEVKKLDITIESLNHGSVIVDSGTTDTFLSSTIMQPFKKVWKEITGYEYKNYDLRLTAEQVEHLPTVLIQLSGHESNAEVIESHDLPPEEIPGLAASIDPDHPMDILVAITPAHYVEYDERRGVYVSRLYIDERSGSVLGANTMRGHDVHFDMDRLRIGWAESDCEYDLLVAE